MKAVRIYAHGGPEVLVEQEVPMPQPTAGTVVIQVRAAGINPVDIKTRKGGGVAKNIQSFPVILGWDVSGVVTALGSGVTQWQLGDAVYGMVGFPQMGSAYAEYTVAAAEHLAMKPKNLDHLQAAAVPLVALTAWQALFTTAQLTTGQTVLIHAASGGVGHMAVQLAKWKGARVMGTTSTRNLEFLRQLGVEEAIDYTVTPFETVAEQVDVVLDPVGGEVQERSYRVIKPGGTLVSITSPPLPELVVKYGIRADRILVKPDQHQLQQITALIEAGFVKPTVETVLPLAQVRKAHELSETGRTRGKIVLELPG
jgi:NADPH:quinone reductase-like Zn-dependent oxidoreductase